MRVAFIGSMGSGKTEATELLAAHGFGRMSFATPVKSICAHLMDEIDSINAQFSGHPRLHWDVKEINTFKGDSRVRHLLQFVGTDLAREFFGNKNIWVEYLRHDLRTIPSTYLLVDDCRFPNEAQMLKEEGFTICRINRDPKLVFAYLLDKVYSQSKGITKQEAFDAVIAMLDHPSETSLDGWPADYVIENNGSIEDFRSNLIKTLDID